jgi:hypothetical protein
MTSKGELNIIVWGRRYSGKTTLIGELSDLLEISTTWNVNFIEHHTSSIPTFGRECDHNIIIYVEPTDDLKADIIRALNNEQYAIYKEDQNDYKYDIQKNKADIIVPISCAKPTILKLLIANYIGNVVVPMKRVTYDSTLMIAPINS